MESGEVIIVIFGRGLWFGNRIEKNLINPNQCRAFGTPIFDDPTNQDRPLGIEEDINIRILMSMVGSTCVFITWYPPDDEIKTC